MKIISISAEEFVKELSDEFEIRTSLIQSGLIFTSAFNRVLKLSDKITIRSSLQVRNEL